MIEWRDISEAPRDGTEVLVTDGTDVKTGWWYEKYYYHEEYVRTTKEGDIYRTDKEDAGYWDSDLNKSPTHFMPLPSPPTEEK